MRTFLKLLTFLLFFGASCKDNANQEIFCTDEYKMVSVRVEFESMPPLVFDYFTVNLLSGDTIRYNENLPLENTYVVLADNYQSELENKLEEFAFIGIHEDTLLFNETYVIGADECHIYKEEGKSVIEL